MQDLSKTLSEQELYALARLPLESFRWNCIAEKNFGFFSPPQEYLTSPSRIGRLWNEFNWKNDNLFVLNLFVISQEGYPFIVKGETTIKAEGKKKLFAVAYLAQDSRSYQDEGYKIDFKWGTEIDSHSETEPFLIELGQVTGDKSNPQFSLTPRIVMLYGSSKLWEIVLILKDNLEEYIEQLIIAVGENNIDCNEYIDRLERLNLFSKNTEVDKFIETALLTLKSAQGFYHRLIYHQNSSNLQYQSCKNIYGRALERKLARINGNEIEPEIFELIDELLELYPIIKTGQDQQNFIEKLSYLFASNSPLFKKLKTNRQEIFPCESYPQRFDIKRYLTRYELRQYQKQGQSIVIEFNEQPRDVGFIFTSEDNLENTDTLIPLKQRSKEQGEKGNRYKLLLDIDDYLFIAAPKNIIKKIELIKVNNQSL